MNKQKVTTNDVLEALSIRLNDTIRPNRSKDKKNNAYFWIFKFTFLIIWVIFLSIIFDSIREIGVFFIYEIAKSLRSIFSISWILVIRTMESMVIVYLLYSQFRIFVESDYYKQLYQKERKLLKKKKEIAHFIDVLFKIVAVIYLVLFGIVAAFSLVGAMYIICMLFDGMYILSLCLVLLVICGICVLLFKHVKGKFFDNNTGVKSKYAIILFVALVASVGYFVYETSSFEYSYSLPMGFKETEKKVVFNLEEDQKIYLKSNSKLDNIELIEDNSLKNQMRVELTYYKTADVKYVSTFNENNDLRLTFTSDVKYELVNPVDILKLFASTISNRNIYNYNLFKYPNIKVYANSEDLNRIIVK